MKQEAQIASFSCPICQDTHYKLVKTFSDGVEVGICDSCSLTYTPKRHLTPDDLFGELSMEKLELMYKPILDGKKRHFRFKIFNKYLSKVKKHSNGKKHLDVGCAHGFFLSISKKSGLEVTGVEPNKTMAEFGRKYLGLPIIDGTLGSVELSEKYDIITFTDSLEYFMDPVKDLSQLIANNLNENGVLFIKVPNGDYFHFRHQLKNKVGFGLGQAEAFSPSKRVAHYNYRTIKKLGEKLNLKIAETGFFLPIDSPVWNKYVGVHLEVENPWYLGFKERMLRQLLHFIGLIEFTFTRKNHFSQAVYIVLKK